jgi:hypothetical protein
MVYINIHHPRTLGLAPSWYASSNQWKTLIGAKAAHPEVNHLGAVSPFAFLI